jgi:hypothetical protein
MKSKLKELEDKLEEQKIKVYSIPMEEVTACAVEIGGKAAIVIDKSKIRNRTHEHTVLAHEFCHIEANTLYKINESPIIKAKCEYRTHKKMVHMLVPLKEFKDLLKRGYQKWEIAEFFEVDESVIDLAYQIYRITGEWGEGEGN